MRDESLIARGHGAYARGKDASSNIAEYLALIEGLDALPEQPPGRFIDPQGLTADQDGSQSLPEHCPRGASVRWKARKPEFFPVLDLRIYHEA